MLFLCYALSNVHTNPKTLMHFPILVTIRYFSPEFEGLGQRRIG